jgi:outer membrane protein OmpA-like peptidoglycan-associated protein
MNKPHSSCLVTLALAGCMSGTPVDRQTQYYALLDPATGVTYNLPLRRSTILDSAALSRVRATSGTERNAARLGVPDQTGATQDASVFVASIGPVTPLIAVASLQIERAAFSAPAQTDVRVNSGPRDNSTASNAISQPISLRLDTDFASAKRLVTFALGIASLGRIGKLALTELVPWARQAEKVYVRGGADSSGNAARNRELAIARAMAVRTAFIAAGVNGDKISTSFCANCYVATNGTEQGRRVNRRVGVELLLQKELFAHMPAPVYALEAPTGMSLIPATAFHATRH